MSHSFASDSRTRWMLGVSAGPDSLVCTIAVRKTCRNSFRITLKFVHIGLRRGECRMGKNGISNHSWPLPKCILVPGKLWWIEFVWWRVTTFRDAGSLFHYPGRTQSQPVVDKLKAWSSQLASRLTSLRNLDEATSLPLSSPGNTVFGLCQCLVHWTRLVHGTDCRPVHWRHVSHFAEFSVPVRVWRAVLQGSRFVFRYFE